MNLSTTDHVDWDADKMLQLYMHDYMIRRGMHKAAEIFNNEAQLPNNVALIGYPYGFLYEWWSIFYAGFTYRQRKDQEIGPESSSKVSKIVDNARNSTLPRTPQTPMREQRPQQMMARTAACSIPSTVSDKQHLQYLAENVESLGDLIKENNLKFWSGTSSK